MKHACLFTLVIFFSGSLLAQNLEYKKDPRPQQIKDDRYNAYQAEQLTSLDILKGLEFAGVRVRKVELKPFEKKYKLEVSVDEYLKGEKVGTTYLFRGDNTYRYMMDSVFTERSVFYTDYIDKIMFYLKEEGDGIRILFSNYSMESIQKLMQKKDREHQFYIPRQYSRTDYKLNESVPLFVYASSWHDPEFDIERFCGVQDLSLDPEGTKELLDNSSHYYVISYKVSE